MIGDNTTLPGGIAAASDLFISNYILKLILKTFPLFSKIVQGKNILLIHGDIIIQERLRKSMFSIDELESAIREHGVDKIKEVDLAILEVDGTISVLSKNYSHRTIKSRKRVQL